jgi:hypothetical protein
MKFVFGDKVKNVCASDDNPHRCGIFVRSGKRTGRFNPGAWIEVTDGRGQFWEQSERSTVPESMPEEEADKVAQHIWERDYGKFSALKERVQG